MRSIGLEITATLIRIKQLLKVSETVWSSNYISLHYRCIKPELKSLALGFHTLTTRTLGKYFSFILEFLTKCKIVVFW